MYFYLSEVAHKPVYDKIPPSCDELVYLKENLHSIEIVIPACVVLC